jgi:hypothetical protein
MGNITNSYTCKCHKSRVKFKSRQLGKHRPQRWDQVPKRSKHPCWPVTSAVSPISKSSKESSPLTKSVCQKQPKNMLSNTPDSTRPMQGCICKPDSYHDRIELGKCWLRRDCRNPCNINLYNPWGSGLQWILHISLCVVRDDRILV